MRLSDARLQAMAAGEHGARLATVREAVEMARELLALRELERAVRETNSARVGPYTDALAKLDALGPASD